MRIIISIIAALIAIPIGIKILMMLGVPFAIGFPAPFLLYIIIRRLTLDKIYKKLTIKGLCLRNRNEFFVSSCVAIGFFIGENYNNYSTGSDVLIGSASGWLVGHFLIGCLGWNQDETYNTCVAYVSVLASAAKADDVLCDKEAKEIIRASQELFTFIGYSTPQNLETVLNTAKNTNYSQQEIIDLIMILPPQLHNSLQFDILRMIFISGTPSKQNQYWLDFIVSSGVFSDWSALQFFSRTKPHSNSRTWALQELKLDPTATPKDIKRAYRIQAQNHHPDKLQNASSQIRGLAEAKMAAINNAYQELTETKIAGGNYFFRSEDTKLSFAVCQPTTFVCSCWLCLTKNQISGLVNPKNVRCGECHAILGTDFDPLQK